MREMNKTNKFLAIVALAGLAACETGGSTPPREMVSLLDNTGRVVAMVPASAAGNTPQGTAVRANIGGTDQTVTLGARQGGASAGTAVVVGNDGAGRPIVERITMATGDLAPPGLPVVTGTDGAGRPIITYVQPGQAAPTGTVAGPRGNRSGRAVAPGRLAPGVTPVVQPNR